MDYTVRRDPKVLDSTGYMEIGPGTYNGQHWQEGFLFVWEDAFAIAEGIVTNHFPQYDHLGNNDIHRNEGILIARDWRAAADALGHLEADGAIEALNLPKWLATGFDKEFALHHRDIQELLVQLADTFELSYTSSDYACIIGV